MYKNISKVEENGIDLERVLALLQLTCETFEDIPSENDKQRAWKLEYFCQRQNLIEALLTSVIMNVKRIHEKNQQVVKDVYKEIKLRNEVA